MANFSCFLIRNAESTKMMVNFDVETKEKFISLHSMFWYQHFLMCGYIIETQTDNKIHWPITERSKSAKEILET